MKLLIKKLSIKNINIVIFEHPARYGYELISSCNKLVPSKVQSFFNDGRNMHIHSQIDVYVGKKDDFENKINTQPHLQVQFPWNLSFSSFQPNSLPQNVHSPREGCQDNHTHWFG